MQVDAVGDGVAGLALADADTDGLHGATVDDGEQQALDGATVSGETVSLPSEGAVALLHGVLGRDDGGAR